MKILQLLLASGAIASRFRRDDDVDSGDIFAEIDAEIAAEDDGECVTEHDFEEICQGNEEADCRTSAVCKWCQGSCNVNPKQIDQCLEEYETIFECIFEKKKSALAEYTGLSKDEAKVITDVISQIPDGEDGENSEARSGFFNMFGSDNMFGQKQEPMIPYAMMPIQNRISAQFISCPVNVPFCQRQSCTSSVGNPQMNALDCYRIAGCCFDNNLFVYKSAFGGGYFPAPVCYRAIRTPIFHALAEQITRSTEFLPNFLIPIADKVDAFIGDENRFNLMLEYHQCLSNAKMAPSRLRLENYLTQVWPGYIWMRMRPQGDNFLGALVDTLSQTCGWDDITSRECMMIGCCWNGQKNRCTHPTDLTKIQPQKLIATATWMMTMQLGEDDEEVTTTKAPLTKPPPTKAPAAPVGIPPGIMNNEGRSGSAMDIGNLDDLFAGLTGRKRRSVEKRFRRQANGKRRSRRQNQSQQEARQGLSIVSPIATMSMLAGAGDNSNLMNTMLMSKMLNNGGNQAAGMMAGMLGNNGALGNMMGNGMMGNNAALGNMMGNNALLGNMMGNNAAAGGIAAGALGNMMGSGGLGGMLGNQAGGAFGNMMGNQGGMMGNMMNSLGGLMNGLGSVNNALFQQMGVSNTNPFMSGQPSNTCPKTQAKLNCMAPPAEDEKIGALFMLNTPKQCEVKGCCWDQNLMHQLLLARKSEGISNIQQFQCAWRAPTVGSKWGLPDLSDSLKGCCSISPCVHTELPAEWTLWGEWTQCTKLCGGGESLRSRACIGNGFCPGMTDDTQREQLKSKQCNMQACESWSLWAPWGACTASCGRGNQERFRSCSDINGVDVAPPGISGGCRGNDRSSQPCKLRPCPEWGTWQQWSACSSTCGIGKRMRRRNCNIPNQCPGPAFEESQCGNACWSEWNMWTPCSRSCYGGERSRTRQCLFQAETGMTCIGMPSETGKCNSDFCETWVNWQPWSDCTDGVNSCGMGSRIRVRECTGVPGQPGCQGEGVEQTQCNIGTCNWSEWTQQTTCSRTCGEGTALYARQCNRPGQCPGSANQQLPCVEGVCPGFQEWGEWATCDVTCGSGRQQRTRECNGQINVDCRGSTNQVKACQMTPCAPQYGTGGVNPYGGYGTQTGFGTQTGYGTQTAYGNNNWGGTSNQPSNTNTVYQPSNTNTGYPQSNTNTGYPQSNTNTGYQPSNTNTGFSNLFGGSGTYYNQLQANPWANVLQGFAG